MVIENLGTELESKALNVLENYEINNIVDFREWLQEKYKFEVLYYDYIDKIARDVLKNNMNIELTNLEEFNPNDRRI